MRGSWKYWLIRGGTEHETDSFFIPAGTGAEVRVFPRSRRQPGTPLEARTTKRLTPPLRVTLRQQNPVTGLWAPADLTGVDRILFRMIDSFGNVVVHDEAASVVGDPTEGMAEYSWRERDVDTAAIYFGRWRVDWESHHEKPLYFPLTSEHLIQIGPTWEQLSMEGGPPARDRFSWAVDTDRGKGVIFGGFDGTDNLNDLWEIDLLTGAWTKIVTTGTPSTRRLTEMAYDSSNKVFWLFGGTAGPVLDELWKYDPATSTFTQVVLTPGPPPLWSHAMEYDPDRKLMLLFGGFGAMQIAWVFDVVLEKWTEILGPGLPPGRGGAMLFFNTTTRRITMFAGNGATSGLAPLSDLWDFDGSAFTQIGTNPQRIPAPPRTRTQGTWDPVRDRIFLFGGATEAGPADDTWERAEDSGIWSEVDSGGDSFAPPPRRNGAIFRHPQGSVFTIFGGQSEVPSVVLGDSWKYTVAERDVARLIGG
ncbi:MAG: hypothetical protein LN413_00265 [Candidatus Thermoplasmatota archaeon]|nr:hypothetical protein [Candidatus Thermoplasmatota archaeon]